MNTKGHVNDVHHHHQARNNHALWSKPVYITHFNNDQKDEVHKSTKEWLENHKNSHLLNRVWALKHPLWALKHYSVSYLFIAYFCSKSCFKLLMVWVWVLLSYTSVILPHPLNLIMLMLGSWLISHSCKCIKIISWTFWNIRVLCIIVYHLEVVDDPNKGRNAWEHSNQEDGLSTQSIPLSAQTVL